MKKDVAIPFWVFSVSWVVTLLIPFAAFAFSPIAGILLGITLPIFWAYQMPTACMGGAFIAFPFAMMEIASGLGWMMFGVRFMMK